MHLRYIGIEARKKQEPQYSNTIEVSTFQYDNIDFLYIKKDVYQQIKPDSVCYINHDKDTTW